MGFLELLVFLFNFGYVLYLVYSHRFYEYFTRLNEYFTRHCLYCRSYWSRIKGYIYKQIQIYISFLVDYYNKKKK
uniref:Uncharacterized protein n=1 Tax=Cyphia banksiana TaxID=2041113 RepID=A0A291F2P1_9ASTR|nr:hypothetical protein Cyp_ban1Pt0356 [Cyphia banksiana]ATG26404.1 hypothetical protein Cyp_ban1Pt0356 [Cyphia banksiana]